MLVLCQFQLNMCMSCVVDSRPYTCAQTDNVVCTGEWTVQEASIAYGGVAAKTLMAPHVAEAIEGQPLSHQTLQAALHAVTKDVQISPTAPGELAAHLLEPVHIMLFSGRLLCDSHQTGADLLLYPSACSELTHPANEASLCAD